MFAFAKCPWLVIADIDDFKHVNDTLGHLQGDAVLRAVGAILADESRGIDVAARYGAEEFVIALPETAIAGALEVAERVRTSIKTEVMAASSPRQMLPSMRPRPPARTASSSPPSARHPAAIAKARSPTRVEPPDGESRLSG